MIKKLLKNKNIITLILAIATGILLVVFGFLKDDNSESTIKAPEYQSAELESYTASVEEKVERHIGKIGGVSNVSVIVTIESTNEKVYATGGEGKDYVIITDSGGKESALQLREINAQIRGISVVCNYCGNEALRQEIISMLASLFNIGTNRISVISA